MLLVSYIQQYFNTSITVLTNQVWKLLIALFKVPNTGAFTVPHYAVTTVDPMPFWFSMGRPTVFCVNTLAAHNQWCSCDLGIYLYRGYFQCILVSPMHPLSNLTKAESERVGPLLLGTAKAWSFIRACLPHQPGLTNTPANAMGQMFDNLSAASRHSSAIPISKWLRARGPH